MKIQNLCLTKKKTWKQTQFAIFCIHFCLERISATVGYNHEETSQRGMALLSNTYKSFYTENYPGCLTACIEDLQCKSLNYWWYSSQCDLNNKTKYSAEAKVFIRDISYTYMGMTREQGINRTVYRSCRHVHPSSDDGEYSIDPTLSGNSFTVYCDMTTDGGGWTAVQKVLFTESNLKLQNTSYQFEHLSYYSDHRQKLTSTALLQLRNEIGFRQIRFYCQKKKVGTVFHIMTNVDPLGEAVVSFFTDDSLRSVRPQTCGSYTVLPDDNSTLSKDCAALGWNGTHEDGKWASHWANGPNRIMQAMIIRVHNLFFSFPSRRNCDDLDPREDKLSPGDTWSIFVR